MWACRSFSHWPRPARRGSAPAAIARGISPPRLSVSPHTSFLIANDPRHRRPQFIIRMTSSASGDFSASVSAAAAVAMPPGGQILPHNPFYYDQAAAASAAHYFPNSASSAFQQNAQNQQTQQEQVRGLDDYRFFKFSWDLLIFQLQGALTVNNSLSKLDMRDILLNTSFLYFIKPKHRITVPFSPSLFLQKCCHFSAFMAPIYLVFPSPKRLFRGVRAVTGLFIRVASDTRAFSRGTTGESFSRGKKTNCPNAPPRQTH